MNIYKVYLDNLTQMLSQFKSDNNFEFDENELLRKLMARDQQRDPS